MQNNNLDKVLEIINSFLSDTELTCNEIDEDLFQYGLDSIIFIRITLMLEESFNIDIPDDYLIMSKLNTINKMVKLISELEKR